MNTPVNRPEPSFAAAPQRSLWVALRNHVAWRGSFEAGLASLRGSYHLENEDSTLARPPMPSILAVADGVGGGAQGKIASAALIEHIRLLTPALMSNPQALSNWLLAANDAVAAAVAHYSDRLGASTFAAAVPWAGGTRWLLTWAGDCRAYCLATSGRLMQLTQDETYAGMGEEPPTGSQADDPARMVGSGAVDKAALVSHRLASSEIMLLCSDGLHKYVPNEQIISLLQSGGSLQERCSKLVAAAHANGGTDDATAVAIQRNHWLGQHARPWLLAAVLVVTAAVCFALYRRFDLDPAAALFNLLPAP